jgi:hypothetical protein
MVVVAPVIPVVPPLFVEFPSVVVAVFSEFPVAKEVLVNPRITNEDAMQPAKNK